MPTFRTATVSEVLAERPGLTRVAVDVHGEAGDVAGRAYALTALTGPVRAGDEVVVNTTAVGLGLGTGGWHVVHWNLSAPAVTQPGPGHLMKLRYTSLQADTGTAEELHPDALAGTPDLAGTPVVVGGLHSQLPCVAVALAAARPGLRVAYVMTDGGSLPLALSDLVPQLLDAGLLCGTVTVGHAFGGDHEALNVPSGLLVARRLLDADVAVVAMGPGSAGTGTTLGFSALEVGPALDAAARLGGRPVTVCRFSLADGRERHRGVSHHTRTALDLATSARTTIGVPRGPWRDEVRAGLRAAGLDERHDVVDVDDPGIGGLLGAHGLRVTTMGRGPDDDPAAFAVAGAAGTVAAGLASVRSPRVEAGAPVEPDGSPPHHGPAAGGERAPGAGAGLPD